jgi:hypothetical protein
MKTYIAVTTNSFRRNTYQRVRQGRRTYRLRSPMSTSGILPRTDSNLRNYVNAEACELLPTINTHEHTSAERREDDTKSRQWIEGWNHADQWTIQNAALQVATTWEQWLQSQPDYGQVRVPDTPADCSRHNYVRGEIRPAGMTPARAFQIALDVFDRGGKRW